MTKVCIKCNTEKDNVEFYAKNKTGWSKYCKDCRRKRQQKVEKQRQRKLQKIKSKAAEELAEIKQKQLDQKIKQLQSEFKRFTLLNRNRLQVMIKRNEGKPELAARTTEAITRRILDQQRAEEILEYQIQLVSAGIKTQHISTLWRSKYGNDTRKSSKEDYQADA